MVTDHSKANEELLALAKSKGLSLPATSPEGTKAQASLTPLSGPQFDHQYTAMMMEDHNKDIALFAKEAQEGQDPQLKAWAAEKLPTLRHHLEMIKGIQARQK